MKFSNGSRDTATTLWDSLQRILYGFSIPDDEQDLCYRALKTIFDRVDTEKSQAALVSAVALEWGRNYPNLAVDTHGLLQAIRSRYGLHWFDRSAIQEMLQRTYSAPASRYDARNENYESIADRYALATIAQKAYRLVASRPTQTGQSLLSHLHCPLDINPLTNQRTALSGSDEEAVLALIHMAHILHSKLDPVRTPLPDACQTLLSHRHDVTDRIWRFPPLTLQFYSEGKLVVKTTFLEYKDMFEHQLRESQTLPPITWKYPKKRKFS